MDKSKEVIVAQGEMNWENKPELLARAKDITAQLIRENLTNEPLDPDVLPRLLESVRGMEVCLSLPEYFETFTRISGKQFTSGEKFAFALGSLTAAGLRTTIPTQTGETIQCVLVKPLLKGREKVLLHELQHVADDLTGILPHSERGYKVSEMMLKVAGKTMFLSVFLLLAYRGYGTLSQIANPDIPISEQYRQLVFFPVAIALLGVSLYVLGHGIYFNLETEKRARNTEKRVRVRT